MRVIAGSAKGTRLDAVPGSTTRPILDRVKTSLFDILRPELAEAELLDLFAGTGAVGIEALSQGAAKCVFCDLEAKAIKTIKGNVSRCHLEQQAEIRHVDAFGYLKNCKRTFDYIFVAPPQYEGLWEQAMEEIASRPSLLKENGKVIVQIDPKEYSPLHMERLSLEQERKYGNTLLLFYTRSDT